ncbi:uncharacterized protein LOC141941178 [Strix uralensis]|uniref:uncharacterized protein LOC141941178 n=1 Tax=Strix uralensis TaxID=36305 RepID=UPI003DA73D5E
MQPVCCRDLQQLKYQAALPGLAWRAPSLHQTSTLTFPFSLAVLVSFGNSKKQSLAPLREDAGCGPSQSRHLPLQGLNLDVLHYVQCLREMLSSSLEGPSPTAFEPVAQPTFSILCVARLRYHCYDHSTFLELRKRKGNTEFHLEKGQRRRKKMGSKLEDLPRTALAEAGKPLSLQQAAALLAYQVFFNIYRKSVQEIQHLWVQGLLQMQRRGCGSIWKCRS